MSANAAIRGYLVQALVCVLDGLNGDLPWVAMTPEPHEVSEQFDILWELDSAKRRATQVKTSTLQISLRMVRQWAAALLETNRADEYELVLVGPVAFAVANLHELDGVKIPTPRPLDIHGLLVQVAHGVDIVTERRGYTSITPAARVAVAQSLVTQISWRAISGSRILRKELDEEVGRLIEQAHTQLQLKTCVLTFRAPHNSDVIEKLLATLREAGQDYGLSVSDARIGSLELHLQGTADGVDRLIQKCQDGTLSELVGYPILAAASSLPFLCQDTPTPPITVHVVPIPTPALTLPTLPRDDRTTLFTLREILRGNWFGEQILWPCVALMIGSIFETLFTYNTTHAFELSGDLFRGGGLLLCVMLAFSAQNTLDASLTLLHPLADKDLNQEISRVRRRLSYLAFVSLGLVLVAALRPVVFRYIETAWVEAGVSVVLLLASGAILHKIVVTRRRGIRSVLSQVDALENQSQPS